ncbi:hypothetical protein BDV97DRAFT_122071 [Delphinella strobiligena]|nr:hypothetical protein BDV97DRAFT_122071 [Delphinella strobiligena]
MTNGSTGLFPEVYTTPAPKATLPISSSQQRGPRLPVSSPSPSPSPSPSASAPPVQTADGSGRLVEATESMARYSNDAPAQPPLTSAASQNSLRSPLLVNSPQTRGTSQAAPHNSVMHETLSVIDEHITDLRTPRQSYLTSRRNNHDADSVYSSHPGHRLSYINGHETDEEEQLLHTESEVMTWSPARVAEYLEDHNVEKEHCNIFREQEISGEVLLHMEQSAVFIKEFELGSVGRRLKTWQKVKALQDEVRSATLPSVPRSVSDYSAAGDEASIDIARSRSASVNTPSRPVTALPGMPGYSGFADRNSGLHRPPSAGNASSFQSIAPGAMRPDSTVRPSAASIRSLNHSRRHSSVGSVDTSLPQSSSRLSHQRQPSASALASASAAARRRSSIQDHKFTSSPSLYNDSPALDNHSFGTLPDPNDFDRGYFSGNEVDNRNKRNFLQKKFSPMHTRNASAVTDSARHSTHFRAHGRVSSVESIPEPVSPILSSTSSQFPFNRGTGNRIVSTPQMAGPTKPMGHTQNPASPIVTKLEYGQPLVADSDTSSANPTPSPASHSFSFFSKPRGGGLRIASDAITQNEKRAQSALKGSPITSPTRTGSTTTSTDTRSFELQKPDTQSRVSTGSSFALAPPLPSARVRSKSKTKKATSAYTRGLERKTPAEQIIGCDYSGWMKKRSSNLMGSWKPRLFVLRGRRLSYYYSETDTEEKGLIDISSHRVLPAENERMTSLHAALTGTSSSPIMPTSATTPTSAATDLAAKPMDASDQVLFIFKLVPPRQGLSKAVNFTKPAVHYFAVNSRQEGRLWMAALMKATIDYDTSGKVVTSYNQKTISLAKARARNERPPALREPADQQKAEYTPAESVISLGENTGLGIDVLEAANGSSEQDTTTGAERQETVSNESPAGRDTAPPG